MLERELDQLGSTFCKAEKNNCTLSFPCQEVLPVARSAAFCQSTIKMSSIHSEEDYPYGKSKLFLWLSWERLSSYMSHWDAGGNSEQPGSHPHQGPESVPLTCCRSLWALSVDS